MYDFKDKLSLGDVKKPEVIEDYQSSWSFLDEQVIKPFIESGAVVKEVEYPSDASDEDVKKLIAGLQGRLRTKQFRDMDKTVRVRTETVNGKRTIQLHIVVI